MKILISFIITVFSLYAQVPSISPFADLMGYKSLKFGMSIDEANDKVTNDNLEIYANFLKELNIRTNTVVRIYENSNRKLSYSLFFYDNYLYRIDISSYIGSGYDNISFSYPVEASIIEDIKEKITAKYGKITKSEVKYFSYKKTPFEEYIYWWKSDIASISLNIKPDLDTLKKTVKLYSYRISFYDEITIKYKVYTDN